LFEAANVRLEVPMRNNQNGYKPQFYLYQKYRKRVETLFSQLDDQFMLIRNYARNTAGVFTRIMTKIAAVTALQYFNKLNNISLYSPLGVRGRGFRGLLTISN
jgi:hypothetical protein